MKTQDGCTQLEKEILQLESELNIFSSQSENVDAIKEYTAISAAFVGLPEGLADCLKYGEVVRPLDVEEKASNQIDDIKIGHLASAQKVLDEFIDQWELTDYGARQGNYLSNLTQKFSDLTDFIEAENKAIWKRWTDGLRAGFAVDPHLLDTQTGLQATINRRNKFDNLVADFEVKIRAIPKDKKVIREIKGIADMLVKLLGEMNFDLSPDLKIFFEQVGSFAGASIDLLSDEVSEYLEANNAIGDYVIKRRFDR
jgi:hypothetical protein